MRSKYPLLRHSLWLFALGCGHSKNGGPTGTGASQTETISSSEGGDITVEGTTLSVPAGALPADTEITVTSTTSPPPSQFTSWASPVFKFDPDGLVFLMPVQVTLEFNGSPTSPVVMWSNASGGYDNLGGTVSGHQITTSVIHFSQGFVVPATILPDAGQVTLDSGSHPMDGGSHPMDGGGSGDGGTGSGSGSGGGSTDGGIVHADGGSVGGDGGTGGGGSADGGTGGGGTVDGGIIIHADAGSSGADGGTGGGGSADGGIVITGDGGSSGADGGTPTADAGGPAPTPP